MAMVSCLGNGRHQGDRNAGERRAIVLGAGKLLQQRAVDVRPAPLMLWPWRWQAEPISSSTWAAPSGSGVAGQIDVDRIGKMSSFCSS